MVKRSIALVYLSAFGLAHAAQLHMPRHMNVVNMDCDTSDNFAKSTKTLHIGSNEDGPLQTRDIPCVFQKYCGENDVYIKATSQIETMPTTNAPPTRSMDLESLTARLKDTRAVGFFTKLSLKNEIDDLVQHIKKHQQGKSNFTYEQLRERFDLLLLKVLTLLQDKDKGLADDISNAKESIWEAFTGDETSESSENNNADKHV